MEFRVRENPTTRVMYGKFVDVWEVFTKDFLIAHFIERNGIGFLQEGYGQAMAGDYVDFLNDKYLDKEINAEWGLIDRKVRIKYHEERIKTHEEQLRILKRKAPIHWLKHGNGVGSGINYNMGLEE